MAVFADVSKERDETAILCVCLLFVGGRGRGRGPRRGVLRVSLSVPTEGVHDTVQRVQRVVPRAVYRDDKVRSFILFYMCHCTSVLSGTTGGVVIVVNIFITNLMVCA